MPSPSLLPPSATISRFPLPPRGIIGNGSAQQILAAALGPVQDLCEGALIYVRAIRRVFEWEER